MLIRIYEKFLKQIYLMLHPALWNHKVHINGIPRIDNIDKLAIGDRVSINQNVYLQCGGGKD